ncbi:DUF2306 domain-containing protein [Ferruginibacter yonginensis]|uniref:DUF2306 domain-containing protein n=1 Tax=Ferruginibacter yonginensis TaxID=1310416 RepID=A0ABV8QVZ1_9BACT
MLQHIKTIIVYIFFCVVTLVMINTVLQYTSFKTNVGFLQLKQAYIGIDIWMMAFYTHVFTSVFVLMAGFTQFSPYILKHHKTLHRNVGKFYVAAILLVNVPMGMIMAIYANGLWPTKLAFAILDILWCWFTYKAYITAQQKKFKAHQQFMIRSFALTFSAITLRLWKITLSHTFHFDDLTLYMIDAWMGFVPNLLAAEWYIYYKLKRN